MCFRSRSGGGECVRSVAPPVKESGEIDGAPRRRPTKDMEEHVSWITQFFNHYLGGVAAGAPFTALHITTGASGAIRFQSTW